MEKPAILGGRKSIEVDYQSLKNAYYREMISVLSELQQDRIMSESISSLEDKFRSHYGVRFAISFNSCTSALFSSNIASGFHQGDEVIVPAYCYPAGVFSLIYTGAVPIFCDVEEDTLSIVKKLITKNTKGIVSVNMWGIPGRLDQLRDIADENELIMIEDSARVIGGELSEKKVGTFGDVGCFSFSSGKVIHTGEGGMLITDSEEIYCRALSVGHLSTKKLGNEKFDIFSGIGFGTKHSIHPLSAFIADVLFDSLDSRVEQSNENYNKFNKMLSEFDFIQTLDISPKAKRGGWSGLAFFYLPSKLGLSSKIFLMTLQAEGLRINGEYSSNVIYDNDAIRNYNLLIGRKFHNEQRINFPVVDRIRSNLIVCDDLCSYYKPMDEFVEFYRGALIKIAKYSREIRKRIKNG